MLHKLPRTVSLALAGALVGLSGKAFKRLYVLTGRISWLVDEYFDWDGRRYIKTKELAQVIGRPITLEDVKAADWTYRRKGIT